MHRIFILSPAKTTGKRASMVLNPKADFALAARLRSKNGAPIGEVFSFLSGLYFRGKLAYARRFASPPDGVESGYVITSDAGLMPVDQLVTARRLGGFSRVDIGLSDARYREPLERTAEAVRELLASVSLASNAGRAIESAAEIVFLGSIATDKYVAPLVKCFGRQLVFSIEFICRGDMSRGGLMLRAVAAGVELEYRPVADMACRSGKRPPKLEPLPPRSATGQRKAK